MKRLKKLTLILAALLYAFMGVVHLITPEQYYPMMPSWLPSHSLLIMLSGIIEILLALLLLVPKSRVSASWSLIAMLIVYFFIVHIPQSIDFYEKNDPNFVASLVRLPIQFLLIAWLWVYTRKPAN